MKMRYKQGSAAAWRDMAYVTDTAVLPFTHAVKSNVMLLACQQQPGYSVLFAQDLLQQSASKGHENGFS